MSSSASQTAQRLGWSMADRILFPARNCHGRPQPYGDVQQHSPEVIEITGQLGVPSHNRLMPSIHLRSGLGFAVVAMFLSCAAFGTAPHVEAIGPPDATAVSDALRQSVSAKGYRVTMDDGWSAEFWFAKALKLQKKDSAAALYPELSDGQFIGVVRFLQGTSDFRGQSLAAGFYTLRYQMLPQDGNHMGVAPNPDFLLASPVADDARPEQAYPYRKLVALSAKSTGTGHPAVIALESAGQPGTVAKEDNNGNIIFSVDVMLPAGASEKLGIVIKGAAAQ